MCAAVVVVVAAPLAVLAALLWLSPGTMRPFLDAHGTPVPGSVSEKTHLRVNGVEQGMFVRGRDRAKPVLLFLHGGPGMPEFFLERTRPSGIEDDFVVCWWEQRGAGLSYHAGIPPESMTVDQLIADTVTVTNYLRQRLGQDKIYLLGHSWGTFLGIQVAASHPELYHAYIGMGQISYQLRSEVLFYQYALEQFERIGDAGMVGRLRAAPVTMNAPLPAAYMKLRDEAMHRLGVGTTHDMTSVVSGVFVPVWKTREYTIRDKIAIGGGKTFSRRFLWDTFLTTDLTTTVSHLRLPVYFCQGRYDYTVNYAQARGYLATLSAPAKGFYTFEHSAHSPLWEQPDRMRQILRDDVLTGQNILADNDDHE
jgi:pimeloyl-ACP methyl ester carboxylesterase